LWGIAKVVHRKYVVALKSYVRKENVKVIKNESKLNSKERTNNKI
jgi:hypothetical protein